MNRIGELKGSLKLFDATKKRPIFGGEKPKSEETRLTCLGYDLEWDYESIRYQVAWKILLIERRLEQIKLNKIQEGVSSLTKKRLKSDLKKTQSILCFINDRINYVRGLQQDIYLCHRYNDKRNEIASKVTDLEEWKHINWCIDI
tara:strand:+ start:2273 stop:2707 length:435 start_codon:yes stop_codon:yes gene_type:complete